MKYLKLFEDINKDLEMCFDGIIDMGFFIRKEGDERNYKNVEIVCEREPIPWSRFYRFPVFKITEDIISSIISSIGKSKEMGFILNDITFWKLNSSRAYTKYECNMEHIDQFIGEYASIIEIYFKK